MTVTIAIIGLGQIGGSIGLALGEHKDLVRRTGHDREPNVSRAAERMGAVDKVHFNLPNAAAEADLVILSLPMDQMRETLAVIASELRQGAVVMDTGPVKETVAAWAAELLPKDRHYVGLTPVINPAYLTEAETGLDAAHPDLFKNGMIAIAAPPGASSDALKMAADLTRLLGSAPLFADAAEVDGLMAATHLLPQLLAAALLNATVDQPGWREGRKLAGRPYAQATAPAAAGLPETLAASVLLNRDNILRLIDGASAALHALRGDIAAGDAVSLQKRLERAHEGHERWLRERQAGDWTAVDGAPGAEMPNSSEIFGRLLGVGRKTKK
jgi:prephenate dehydrogenase